MAFHGTTDAIQISDKILPYTETGYLRESFRRKNLDVVFLTVSKACGILREKSNTSICLPHLPRWGLFALKFFHFFFAGALSVCAT